MNEAEVADTGAIKMIRFKSIPGITPGKYYCVLLRNVEFHVEGGAVQLPIDGPRFHDILRNAQG